MIDLSFFSVPVFGYRLGRLALVLYHAGLT